ncbi:unnamed protein product [Caenorhabditis brenneri]
MLISIAFLLFFVLTTTAKSHHKRFDLENRTLTRTPYIHFYNKPIDVALPAGEVLVLECGVNSAPTASLQWEFEGKVISGSLTVNRKDAEFNHGKLVSETMFALSTLQVECPKSGVYTCKATNTIEEIHIKTHVTIVGNQSVNCFASEAPKIVQNTDLRFELNDNTVSLYCEAEGEDVTLTWTKGGKLIQTNEMYTVLGNELLVHNISWSNEGDYTCEASNNFGSDSRVVTLNPISLDKNIIL